MAQSKNPSAFVPPSLASAGACDHIAACQHASESPALMCVGFSADILNATSDYERLCRLVDGCDQFCPAFYKCPLAHAAGRQICDLEALLFASLHQKKRR